MLEVDKIKFSYTKSHKEMFFDFSVKKGDCVALIGPSGSGKSTLLNLIAGFESPSSGKIIINNVEVTKQSPEQRSLSSIFQEHNLFHHLTVEKNIQIAVNGSLKITDEQQELIHTYLKKLGLLELKNRYPYELSGGQRQRVAIARCLAREKPIMLLDEPFVSLDPSLRYEMLDLIGSIKKEKKFTIIMSTHFPEDSLIVADKAAFIYKGKILKYEKTRDLFNNNEIPEISKYLGRKPQI